MHDSTPQKKREKSLAWKIMDSWTDVMRISNAQLCVMQSEIKQSCRVELFRSEEDENPETDGALWSV